MTDDNGSNGQSNGQVYVTFGEPGHEVELSLAHASGVLGLLWERHRPMLSAYIGEAYTGVRPSSAGRPKAQ